MSTLKTLDGPRIDLTGVCNTCRVKHEIRTKPGSPFMREMDEWSQKHLGHEIEFISPRRLIPRDLDDRAFERTGEAPWWLEHKEFDPNANIKLAWASSAAYTMTSLNSLASDTNLLAGASSLAVDNTSNLYLDYLIAGFCKNNTSSAPTVNTVIYVYAYRSYDDGPTYPDVLAGTDAAKTLTTVNIRNSSISFVNAMIVAATTSQVNAWNGGAISGYFGGVVPKLHGLWIVHNSGQALAASGNTQSYQGSYLTSV